MSYCIACRTELPKEALFVLENAPASAQNIPDAAEVGEDKGITLNLRQCPECGLVQFDCTPVDYYRDVIRAGGFSTTMTELRRRQYKHMIDTYGLEGKKFIEVGCGRGEFINVLREFPVQVFGMEHKEDLITIARDSGLCVWREFPETPDQKFIGDPTVEGSEGPYDAFLSFNFLEHQPYPDVMLTAIYNNLVDGGMGLVTVPALEYIVERGNYYELIRDHIAYYSFDALRNLLENNGFKVLEEEMINRDTISMIVKKMSAEERAAHVAKAAAQEENIVASLIKGHEIVLNDINHLLDDLAAEQKTIALWGASHQGFTLASTTPLCERVSYIIDSAPFKQGRFAPASHLPIVAPDHFFEHPVDVIMIVAPGYSDEIANVIRTRFGADVRILTLRSERIEEL
ncbi:MAG: methyltransferase domain-containing protein [Lachnospiraceae bacterium]|nr:methyltransferase domain-containing protein [Lachnospiraceae bacterium]